MSFEVEMKFWVDDVDTLREKIEQLAGPSVGRKRQEDRYFNHPVRDFRQTDEAIRVRMDGPRNVITYKGPKLDAQTKTRREIEIAIAEGDQAKEQMVQMFEVLGFQEVRSVKKERETFKTTRDDLTLEIVIDQVEDLGVFTEIEAVADDASVDKVREQVIALAAELGLTKSERRSYLEMISQKAGQS